MRHTDAGAQHQTSIATNGLQQRVLGAHIIPNALNALNYVVCMIECVVLVKYTH